MGLFATIASQASETVVKKSTSSSLDLPTVVQLYRGLAPIRLEQSTAQIPSYAVLSYAAVPVTSSLTSENEPPETPMGGTSTRGSRKQTAIVPELGLWNCSVSKRRGSQQSYLQDGPLLRIPNTPSTFCLTVDLSKPSQVESTLTLLQETLVRYLIARPAAPASSSTEEKVGEAEDTKIQPETATTSLYALRSVQFGLAPNDDASAEKMAGEAPDENDRKVMVTLLICAQLAPSTEEYRDKQTQALLLYHMRRYSASLKAHLCFVGGDDVGPHTTAVAAATSGEEQGSGINISTAAGTVSNEQQPAVSKRQLAAVFLHLAQGKALDLSVLSDQEATAEASPETAAVNPLVYGPLNAEEQDELIETVLLRNANYQGQWDASKDSLWKVLPPGDEIGDSSSKVDSAKKTATAGDNTWMQELLDSVEAGAAKTPPRKPKKGPASSAQKTPNDAAVSDFFSNLLQS